MIATLLRISRLSLRRDRVAQAMVFVLPIAFFSIFASIFGRPQMNATPHVSVALVDEDRSERSRALVAALRDDGSLGVRDSLRAAAGGTRAPLDRAAAERLVRGGDVPVAVVIPAGWGAAFPGFDGSAVATIVLADPSDPVAKNVIVGLLQRAGARVLKAAAPEFFGGAGDGAAMLVRADVRDVAGERGTNGQGRRMIAFYAAGVAVMFLLFSCSAGGGTLLDEQDSGTLDRVLGTRVGMGGLLAGKWIHLTVLGVTQITVMFAWGALAFHLDLLGHLPGFAVMTLFTAAAAAGFGLVLATACRTRPQLSGISTLVILTMSALGGSMFPRFLMSPGMQKMGLVTFNAWALDGYQKVFWRDLPVTALAPQLAVLAALTAAFLVSARLLARRWEAA